MDTYNYQFYRPGAIAVLFNEAGQVFVAERADSPGAWQLPQGGVDPGEEAYTAVVRELLEETGIQEPELDFLFAGNFLTSYDWPEDFKQRMLKRKPECADLKGACHQWFYFRFTGDTSAIDVSAAQDKEFRASAWVSPSEIIANVDMMRRDCYKEGFAYWHQQCE